MWWMMPLKTLLFSLLHVGACTPDPESKEHQEHAETPPEGKILFEGQIAPLLSGMGQHDFDISSTNEQATVFFNQAIALTYGFNHLEAGRSYKQVALIEPNAAIAYWGQALVLGPNINGLMEPSSVKPAYQAIQKAISLKDQASEKESALIDALATRYSDDESLSDRAALDKAYAQSMRLLVDRFPQRS